MLVILRTVFIAIALGAGSYVASLSVVPEPFIIHRTKTGFEPRMMVVPLGTTITFVNKSRSLSWPASDTHPHHSSYPAFDPKRALDPGEAWSFTFDTPGLWGFHDHLEASYGGRIIVVPPEGISALCAGSDQKECWSAILADTLEDRGLDAAFDMLDVLHAQNERFAASCHNYAHDIGLKAYGIYGAAVPLSAKTSYCNAGFFHGYMEGFVNDFPEPDDIARFCARVKRELEAEFPLAEGQCLHGVGHGGLETLIQDEPYLWHTPDAMLARATAICYEITDSRDYLKRCTSGAFDVFRTWAGHAGEFDYLYEPDVLFDRCAVLTEDYAKEGCYHELGKLLMRIENPGMVASVFDFRANITPEDYDLYAPVVAHAFAINVGKRGVREKSFAEIIRFCRAAPLELQSACTTGLLDGIQFAGEPGNEFVLARSFCMSGLLKDDEKRACFAKLVREVRYTYETARLAPFCETVPHEYRDPSICP